jgi:NADH-quinone oxidoreductase subunit N
MTGYALLLPKATIALAVILGLMIDSLPAGRARRLGVLAGAGLFLVGLGLDIALVGQAPAYFWHGAIVIDRVSVFADLVLLALGLVVTLAALDGVGSSGDAGDFFLLLSLSLFGSSVLASAGTLVVVFLAIELAIIPTFALVAFRSEDRRGFEAALKYFILSVFASAVLFYGISLVYGMTGSVAIPLPEKVVGSRLLYAGLGFVLAGFGFKLAAFPFHQWLPDAFDVSYPEVAAFLAVGPKVAAVAALARILQGLAGLEGVWGVAVAVVAVLTMVYGNLAALRQERLKRMLAYSAIAHAGYALVGVAAGSVQGMEGAVLYFGAYGAGAVGAFLVVAALNRQGIGDRIAELGGMGRTRPALAAVLTVCLLSLIGLPLFAGFWGKFSVFFGAVEADWAWLAVIGVLNSAVSFGYYGNVIRKMYFEAPIEVVPASSGPTGSGDLPAASGTGWALRVALGLSLGLTLLLGIVPRLLFGALG